MVTYLYTGSCHCQNITLVLESSKPPEMLGVRADNCSFCRLHQAAHTSDPQGRLSITIQDEMRLGRYRFATRTADFLLCRECGVYVGAIMTEDGVLRGVANVNIFDKRSLFSSRTEPVNFEDETAEERQKRRSSAWTPATLTFAH